MSLAATKWLASAWKDLPSAQGIHVDGAVLGFACAVVCAAALLAGLLPAISSTSKMILATLQASSRTAGGSLSRTALRKTLLTVEIAVTVVLLIAAGLLLKSFVRLRTADLGCATDNVLTMGYSLPKEKYDKPEKVNAFNETLLERLRALPGVRAVALGSTLPGDGYGGDDVFTIPEHPPITPGAELPDALTRTGRSRILQCFADSPVAGPLFHRPGSSRQGEQSDHQPRARPAVLPRREPHRQASSCSCP